MASSPSHKFGQIIGDALEATIEPVLATFAEKYLLFLDKKGARKVRKGRKVTWKDSYENGHDLDFVLEKGGAEDRQGEPLAFIELAWRRYTKHSRNKAQEIQGAIIPLRDKHKHCCPFIGVILAGEFTESSLTQLRSLGFEVAHFSYESVIKAFESVEIDASFDSQTPDNIFKTKNTAWEKLSKAKRILVYRELAKLNEGTLKPFIEALAATVERTIDRIRVLPLYGSPLDFATLREAIFALNNLQPQETSRELARVEVQIRYANGSRIDADFATREEAIGFLNRQTPSATAEGKQIFDEALKKLS